MCWRFVVVLALLCGSAPAAGAPVPGRVGFATVSLSSARAGAGPVVVTVELGYTMQCGYPGPGPVLVGFPRQVRVPSVLPPSRVLVDGRPAPTVAVSGRTVSVGLAPPPQVMCDVLGPGRLTIVFRRAAGFGNPVRAGNYAITVRRGTALFSAPFTIRHR